MMEKLGYTIDEFAEKAGLGRTKIYEELNSGRLKGVTGSLY